MTNNQENKIRSYIAIKGVFDENKAVIDLYPSLKESVDQFNLKFKELDNITSIQGMGISGVTEEKNVAKMYMATVAGEIAGVGKAYATEINNREMIAGFNYSSSIIYNSTEQRSTDLAKSIYALALKHAAVLEKVMVSPNDLAELHDSIERYIYMRNRHGSTKSVSKVSTSQLRKVIKEISSLLKSILDAKVNKIRRQHSLFAELYDASRDINNLGHRRRKEVVENAAEAPSA